MKKQFFLNIWMILGLILFAQHGWSQAPNLFPPAGSVGIGTTTPQSQLHVVGNSRFDGNANILGNLDLFGDIHLWNYAASGNPTQLLGMAQDGTILPIGASTAYMHYLEVDSAIKVGDSSIYIIGSQQGFPENHIFSTHGPLVLNGIFNTVQHQNTLLNSYGGSVGIGFNATTLPVGYKFSVNGTANFTSPVGIGTTPAAGNSLRVSATGNDAGILVQHMHPSNGGSGAGIKVTNRNVETRALSVSFDNNLTDREKFAVFGDGIVNIGNNLPRQGDYQVNIVPANGIEAGCRVKLDYPNANSNRAAFLADVPFFESKAISVISRAPNYNNTTGPREVFRVDGKGVAWMQEIRVRLSPFPDYVFEGGYDLMSLDSLQQYVNDHHHLPGMPSAEEVEREHANLGEIVRLQQEKIEELTLYILELKTAMDHLSTTTNK